LKQVLKMSETIRTERLAALYADAEAAAENSYSPYSKFRVGAALLLTNGQVVTGTNVENVSYGLTICAERSAIVRAVAEQGPAVRIAAIAIANLNGAASPPCGACRQVIAEFADAETPVVFPAGEGVRTVPFSQILPFAFDADLKK
jgi:cytidine deaminase